MLSCTFFFYLSADHLDLHSFPHDALPIFPGLLLAVGQRHLVARLRRLPAAANHLGLDGVLVQRQGDRSEEHTSELQSQSNLVCRLLLEKKKNELDPESI